MDITVKPGRMVFDAGKVASVIRKRELSAIIRAAKYVHKATRHSIRKSKSYSKPGKAPHTRQGAMKNAVSSRVYSNELRAEIGVGVSLGSPSRLSAIAGLLEHGGVEAYKAVTFKKGEYGPIEVARSKSRHSQSERRAFGRNSWMLDYVFAPLRSDAQVIRANRIADSHQVMSGRYAARPFVRPALERSLPKIMSFFNK